MKLSRSHNNTHQRDHYMTISVPCNSNQSARQVNFSPGKHFGFPFVPFLPSYNPCRASDFIYFRYGECTNSVAEMPYVPEAISYGYIYDGYNMGINICWEREAGKIEKFHQMVRLAALIAESR